MPDGVERIGCCYTSVGDSSGWYSRGVIKKNMKLMCFKEHTNLKLPSKIVTGGKFCDTRHVNQDQGRF